MMTTTQKIKAAIPFLILLGLLILLYRELFYSTPGQLPSALIGEPVPNFQLPTLFQPQTLFTQKELQGRVILLNVWATWCPACTAEHPMLMKISQQYHIPIYGIDYKDDPDTAKNWLIKNGNPYKIIGNDTHGDAAIDFGVYGTPETFIITPQGKILYRHIGSIDQKTWDEVLYPLVRKYENESL